MKPPTLLYDGDCGFCQYCVNYLKQITGDQVGYQPYQQGTLGRPLTSAQTAIQLVVSKDEYYEGAAAGFKVLTYGKSSGGWWLYQHLPGFKWVSEKTYIWITHHRDFCFTIAKVICGHPWKVGRLPIVLWGLAFFFLVVTFVLSL